jgi:arylsulfatase A-like enzyme
MTRYPLAGITSVALVAFSALGCGNPRSDLIARSEIPQQSHPLIIIDIDTLRADHLGCYGYHRPTSPNIDEFAEQSVLFEWAFSQAPNTPPSQTSILSGLYPGTHGMIFDEDRVPDEANMLAEVLAEHGFTTAGFHDGGYMSNTFNIGQGFTIYDNNRGQGLAAIGPKVFDWLRAHHSEDFLLLVHTYDTHTPYAPPPPFDEAFVEGVPEPSPGFVPDVEQMEAVRLSKYTDELRTLADNDLAWAISRYDAEIQYVDAWFGEFMALVRELNLDERATIVVISDHGEEFQEHGSVLHEKLYATVTRIPFLIRFPGGGITRRVGEPVEGLDLMPTLLDISGCPIPPEVQGESLVPVIRGLPDPGEHHAFSESPYFGERRVITSYDWRFFYTHSNDSIELYRYREDPLEQDDLSQSNESDIDGLRERLLDWDQNVRVPLITQVAASREELDAATREQLEALGYIQGGIEP